MGWTDQLTRGLKAGFFIICFVLAKWKFKDGSKSFIYCLFGLKLSIEI